MVMITECQQANFKTFSDCVSAQQKKGKSKESAGAICGQIEKNTKEGAKRQAASNLKYEENNRLFIKAFLLDASKNINQWGVTQSSLDRQINTFIGKPLVLTENFRHPMPPESDKVSTGDYSYYDDDEDPYNTVKVDEVVDHWLAYQEAYRVGSIVDINFKNGIYYATIEITDEAAKEAFKNNDLPLFVSPAIAQLNPLEDPRNITNWTGIHLAIVSDPAYTIKKAIISGQCHESGQENGKCLIQLRQASVNSNKKLGCGFCRWNALAKYATVVREYGVRTQTANDFDSFLNSSIQNSNTNLKIELTDQQDNNTNNNNQTTDTNKPQDFDRVQKEQGGDLGEQTQKSNVKVKTVNEKGEVSETEVTKQASEIGIKVAGMQECVNIFQQNGVDPQQAGQICKLAAQALMDNQNQQAPGGGVQGQPKPSGQFGSTDIDKLLEKKNLQIEKLTAELKDLKKNDKTDAQRIAELEELVSNLNLNIKEKEFDSYLLDRIPDLETRTAKVKKFATLNWTLNDLKEIYDDVPAPTATTGKPVVKKAEVEVKPVQTGKVKLQTASTNEGQSESNVNGNEVKERNSRILSSLLNQGGINQHNASR